jgi:VWFA-related protein
MPLRRSRLALFLCVALLLMVCAVAHSQPAPRPPASDGRADQSSSGSTTIRVDVNLVSFPVTATDSYGRYVGSLRHEDFRLLENGAAQHISVFHSEIMPVSVGIVIDTSGSMANKLPQAVDALERFVRTIQPEDDVFLMRFSSGVELMLDFTGDRELFSRAARRLRAVGSTHLYDALADALDRVRQGRHQKKALVLITDGEDTSSHVTFNEVLDMARASEVMAYCIGIGQRERGSQDQTGAGQPQTGGSWPGGNWPGGSWPGTRLPIPLPIPLPGGIPGGRRVPMPRQPSGGGPQTSRADLETVDMQVLEAIADATGGRAFHLQRVDGGGQDSIDATTQQISDELRHQYTVGYYPTNTVRDGSYRRIDLSTRQAGVQLRYRRGYYAPRG